MSKGSKLVQLVHTTCYQPEIYVKFLQPESIVPSPSVHEFQPPPYECQHVFVMDSQCVITTTLIMANQYVVVANPVMANQHAVAMTPVMDNQHALSTTPDRMNNQAEGVHLPTMSMPGSDLPMQQQ